MKSFYEYKSDKWQLFILKKVDSTMNEIKKDVYKNDLNTLLMAYQQTNGKGRRNNKWISNLGNIFLSIKLNTFNLSKLFILNYLVGVIIYDTLSVYLKKNNDLLIKWPNDLLIGKKKVAGILIDAVSKGKNISDIYIGIGINTKIAPSNLEYETTCLKKEGVINMQRKKILNRLIYYFDYWSKMLEVKNFQFILKYWMQKSFPVNSNITFKYKDTLVNGVYKGINLDGSIRILIDNKENNFFSLDVIF